MMNKSWLGISLVCLWGWSLSAQETLIYLNNPSFEGDIPQDATVPANWHTCKQGTTPDILPGPWGVYQEPAEGETFVGLITRLDGSWESIGQRTSAPLLPGECYSLSLDLAHAQNYSGYNNPVKLRVVGGSVKCARDQVLEVTDFIEHEAWKTYTLKFVPKKEINYIILEAFYQDSKFAYKGNILIDNIRPIKKCIRA